jgi:hypothetical protein
VTHITPRNRITIKGTLPKRWEFLSIQHGVNKTWDNLLAHIDTVAEHADALMNANGISADSAIDQAINDLIKSDRLEYTDGYYWNLTPTHRKTILEWMRGNTINKLA